MNSLETVESLHSYAERLHRNGAQLSVGHTPRRGTVRELVRRVRRSG